MGRIMKKRIIIVSAVSAVLLAAVLAGLAFARRSNTVVKVYDFSMVGMTEYWGDNKESYGPVSTDKIQTVFLSDTQEVTEVLVSQGDMVKKGDLLLRFDTTLTELSVERKRLEVEKVKLQLQDAQNELVRIKSMKPLVPREPEDVIIDYGEKITGADYFRLQYVTDDAQIFLYTGEDAQHPAVIWLQESTPLTPELLNHVRTACRVLRWKAAQLEIAESEDPEREIELEEIPEVGSFFAVIKMTREDYEKGNTTVWQGVHIVGNQIDYLYPVDTYSDPLLIEDEFVPEEPDDSSGYTYAEIQKMRQAKEKEIKELEFKVKTVEAAYKIALAEAGDGNIYAQTDGRITALLTEEEAKENHMPILKLSGGGGFYIRGTVNELDRESLAVGQSVNIQDWQNGGFYEGSVVSVGEFPAQGERNYGSNPNASYYPFMVFVDESADLAAGSYVSIQYSLEGQSGGVYLEMPFLRSEHGENYVLVQGENGRLEKRVVTTGKSLWGSYIQITSGLSQDDKIAFPYGKNVAAGARCEPGDLSDLYGY